VRQRVNGATHDFLKSRPRPPWLLNRLLNRLPNRLLLAMTQLRRRLGAGQSCLLSWQEGGEASWSACHVMITAWLARVRMLE
jgi:hypothetical protein